MRLSGKTRVVEKSPSPVRTLYNDLDFERFNEIHKRARGVHENNDEKASEIVEEKSYAV